MTITGTTSSLNTALSPEAEKQESFLQTINARAKEFLDHYRKYYSKTSDNGRTTAIGRMVQGTSKRQDNSAAAFLKNMMAGILFEPATNINGQGVGKFLKSIFMPLGHSIPSAPHARHITNADFLNREFEFSTVFASDALAHKIDAHITDYTFAAELTANQIAKAEFVGPLRENMQKLTGAFLDKEISQADFTQNASKTLLQYNGIVKSEQGYAISAEKFDSMSMSFGNSTAVKREAPVLIFNEVTQVHSFDAPQGQERKGLNKLVPILAQN